MIAENHHYGHAGILREYAGLSRVLPIPGRLQHGWMPGPGVRDVDRSEPWLKLIWSQRNLSQCEALGIPDVVALGAPFLYLPQVEPRPALNPKSVLVFPFHGWEKQPLHGNLHRYAVELEALERQGFGPLTVCLYWMEFEDESCRRVFEERGFRVVTMGRRDGNERFLHRLRAEVTDHAYVTSNRVCTAAFYALHCRRPFFLYGPPMGLSQHDDPTGEEFDRWQRKEFPELTFEAGTARTHAELGDRELGLEFKRSQEEVAELFAWRRRDLLRRTGLRALRRAYPLLRKF